MTETEPTEAEWLTTLRDLVKDWSPETISADDPDDPTRAYLSIPVGYLAALDIEQVDDRGHRTTLCATLRSWDQSHGLESETELGEMPVPGALVAIPLILAGMRTIEEKADREAAEAERRMAEDDAAWETGGYVA